MSNLAIIIVGVVGAGIVLLIYNALVVKTKKVSGEWVAEVYTVSDATRVTKGITLKDLRLHSVDKLRKIELKGNVIYSLISLGKTTPAVTNNCEETIGYDGKNPKKRVRVLMNGDNCTLLKTGGYYDGEMVFEPLSYDKNNQIQNDLQLHESRHQKKDSFWNQIAPFLNIMVISLMIIVTTMLIGNTQAKISVENTAQLAINTQAQQVISENIAISNLIANGFTPNDLNVLKDNIAEIKDLVAEGDVTLGKQKTYKDNSSISTLE